MKKESGTIGDLIAIAMCMLAMTILMTHYMGSVRIIQQKMEVSQIARKYILRMETMGRLTEEDRELLCKELTDVGVEALQLEGTTTCQVTYGEEVVLLIQGELGNGYDFTEKRVSTAKY